MSRKVLSCPTVRTTKITPQVELMTLCHASVSKYYVLLLQSVPYKSFTITYQKRCRLFFIQPVSDERIQIQNCSQEAFENTLGSTIISGIIVFYV